MTLAYPLSWPEGWPRSSTREDATSKFERGTGSFQMRYEPSVGDVYRELMNELQLLGAKNVVVSANLKLRQDGKPYADQANPKDPGVAVYFTLDKQQSVMARDAYIKAIHNIRSLTLAVSGLRQMQRHGGRYIAGRAFQGFAALPAPGAIDWPSTLQVKPTATREEIEAAFRRLAKERHPDQGGSDVLMAELTQARAQALKDKSP